MLRVIRVPAAGISERKTNGCSSACNYFPSNDYKRNRGKFVGSIENVVTYVLCMTIIYEERNLLCITKRLMEMVKMSSAEQNE